VRPEGGEPDGGGGLSEVDWETAGQRMVRNELAVFAERWGWEKDRVLQMPVKVRKSYWHRMIEFVEREKRSAKK
jgi:hypothetical protein